MNIIASPYLLAPNTIVLTVAAGDALWPYSDSSRETASASACTRQGPAWAWSWTHQTRGEREETRRWYQEKCKIWAVGSSVSSHMDVLSNSQILWPINPNNTRMLAKSWQRTLYGHADMFSGSIRCVLNCRLLAFGYRHCEVTNRWPTLCGVPLV